MTTTATKPIYRLIRSALVSERAKDVHGRPIIVGVHPDGTLTFRLKGTRAILEMHVLHAYELARRAAMREERARRKSAREKRRLEAMLARAFDRSHPLHDDDPAKLFQRPRKRKARRTPKRRTRRTAR
jgi:hypothetical protein